MHIGRFLASKLLPDKVEHALFDKLPDWLKDKIGFLSIVLVAAKKYKEPGLEWLRATDVLLELGKKDAAELTPDWEGDDKMIEAVDKMLDGVRKEIEAEHK